MSDVEFSIVTTTDTIRLITDHNEEGTYRLLSGTAGLGLPPTLARFSESASDGGRFLGSRIGLRDPELEIRVYGTDRRDVESNLRRLAAAFSTASGLPRLVAQYDTGESFELPFVYLAGAESSYSPTSSENLTTWLVMLRCPDPYWVARDAMSVVVRQEATALPFMENLAALPTRSASNVGSVQVSNPGDVEAFVDYRIVGPADSVTVDMDGVGFTVDAELTESDLRFIDGRAATIVDQDGVSRYGEFGPAPKFPRLPPGESTVVVDMEGADPGTWEVSDDVLYTNRVVDPALRGDAADWGTWSNGAGAQSHAVSGFAVDNAGYMQILWSGTAQPRSAIWVDVPASPGELISPAMTVWSSRAQVMQPGIWFFDSDGQVIASVHGPTVPVPASVPVRVGMPGSAILPTPPGTVSARFVVSTFVSECVPWQSGDRFRASLGSVTDTGSLLDYFDGDSENCDWVDDADDSASVQYALERVGQSEVALIWRPRRAIVY